MTTQHTPGPWYIDCQNESAAIGYRAIVDNEGYTVCSPSPMGQANARLIAAAPDLLAALKDLLGDQPFIQETGDPQAAFFHCIHCGREYGAGMDESADDCDDDCPGMIARAAIAKATGEA